MFPPLHRFWPSYLVTIAIFIALTCLGIKLFCDACAPEGAVYVLYSGVWVAYVSILSSSWSQWRSSSVQQAMSALQALRTDREYLINAAVVKKEFPTLSDPKPMNKSQKKRFLNPPKDEISTVDKPSFADASGFVLNQYEFLAAAARQGAVDEELLKETITGVLRGIVVTYSPAIAQLRQKNASTFQNLVWLYREFSDDHTTPLGP